MRIPYDMGIKMLDLSNEVERFYLFTFDNVLVLTVPLSVSDVEVINRMQSKLPEYVLEDWICSRCVIACSKNIDWITEEAKAGYAGSVARFLIQKSAINTPDEFKNSLDEERHNNTKVYRQLESIICQAFKQITPKDIRSMKMERFIECLVESESILKIQLFEEPKRKGPPVAPGYSDIGQMTKEWLLSKEAADTTFDKNIP